MCRARSARPERAPAASAQERETSTIYLGARGLLAGYPVGRSLGSAVSLAVVVTGCSSAGSGAVSSQPPTGADGGSTAVVEGATAPTVDAAAGGTDGAMTTPPGSDGAASNAPSVANDAGVNGIYRSCGPVALPKTYTDSLLSLRYPSDWTGSALASNEYGLASAPYSYLPTGQTAPAKESALVKWLTGETINPGSAPEMVVVQNPSGYPGAVVRQFQIDGEAAAAWWYEFPPAECGECPGPGDPGPDYIAIGVSAVHGNSLVEIDGMVRIDAPDAAFCAVQAVEASLAFH